MGDLGKLIVAKALKSCPKSIKLPNLVTLNFDSGRSLSNSSSPLPSPFSNFNHIFSSLGSHFQPEWTQLETRIHFPQHGVRGQDSASLLCAERLQSHHRRSGKNCRQKLAPGGDKVKSFKLFLLSCQIFKMSIFDKTEILSRSFLRGKGWKVSSSVTRLGDLLDFGQLFKALGNN